MHTFYLLLGEMKIILEDVRVQLGLPIDGELVTFKDDVSSICTYFILYLNSTLIIF